MANYTENYKDPKKKLANNWLAKGANKMGFTQEHSNLLGDMGAGYADYLTMGLASENLGMDYSGQNKAIEDFSGFMPGMQQGALKAVGVDLSPYTSDAITGSKHYGTASALGGIGGQMGMMAGGMSAASPQQEQRQPMINTDPTIDTTELAYGGRMDAIFAKYGCGGKLKYADGGELSQSPLSEFEGASHENGGIDIGVAEVEGKETIFNEEKYVFSERLKNKDGVSFAQASKKIKNKYKDRDDPQTQQARKEELMRLADEQDVKKEEQKAKDVQRLLEKYPELAAQEQASMPPAAPMGAEQQMGAMPPAMPPDMGGVPMGGGAPMPQPSQAEINAAMQGMGGGMPPIEPMMAYGGDIDKVKKTAMRVDRNNPMFMNIEQSYNEGVYDSGLYDAAAYPSPNMVVRKADAPMQPQVPAQAFLPNYSQPMYMAYGGGIKPKMYDGGDFDPYAIENQNPINAGFWDGKVFNSPDMTMLQRRGNSIIPNKATLPQTLEKRSTPYTAEYLSTGNPYMPKETTQGSVDGVSTYDYGQGILPAYAVSQAPNALQAILALGAMKRDAKTKLPRVSIPTRDINLEQSRAELRNRMAAASGTQGRNVRNMATSGGQALTNLMVGDAALQGSYGSAIDNTYQTEQNANAQARNQAIAQQNLTNLGVGEREILANEQAKAQRLNMLLSAVGGMGQAGGQAIQNKSMADQMNARDKMIMRNMKSNGWEYVYDPTTNGYKVVYMPQFNAQQAAAAPAAAPATAAATTTPPPLPPQSGVMMPQPAPYLFSQQNPFVSGGFYGEPYPASYSPQELERQEFLRRMRQNKQIGG